MLKNTRKKRKEGQGKKREKKDLLELKDTRIKILNFKRGVGS
jgi:hypothetical protein